MSIASSFLEHARRTPHRAAVVLDGGERRDHRELSDAVTAAAAAFRDTIGGRDARVGLLMPPGAPFLEGFLGAAHAGMAAMVLQTGWSTQELGTALAAGQPEVTLTTPALMARLQGLAGPSEVVCVGDDGVAAALRHAPVAAPAKEPVLRTAATGAAQADEHPFYIGFTSGTMGRPKGFVRNHRSWLRSFEAATEVFGIGGSDRVLAPGPLEHSLFLFAAVHGLSVGASVHLLRRFSAHAALRLLRAEENTVLYVVPTMLAALVTAAERERTQFPHVASLICSGARWPTSLDARVRDVFPSATTFDFYDASELSFVSVRRGDDRDPPTSVGRPFPGVAVSVRRDDKKQARVDEPKHLWVKSDMLFSGYLDASDGNAQDAHGWITVGDMGRFDAQGRLHLVGREGAMLICGGLNVYPEEIESVLLELPEIAEAAVVGLPHPRWGDQLCAVVRWEGGRTIPRARLRAHCRSRLARGKRPQRWLSMDELPRTPAGKLARSSLAEALRTGVTTARTVP